MMPVLWKILGITSIGMAYVGLVTPGIPWSIFVVFAAYCFAKSSPAMHSWIYSHKIFGPFLTNWTTKKVFPLRAKYFMIATMASSLIIIGVTLPIIAAASIAVIMGTVAIWTWRFPSTVEEHDARVANGDKIGWFK